MRPKLRGYADNCVCLLARKRRFGGPVRSSGPTVSRLKRLAKRRERGQSLRFLRKQGWVE